MKGFWLTPLELALQNSCLYGKAQIEVAELEMCDLSMMTSASLTDVFCVGVQGTGWAVQKSGH